jgi:hypothetical protein
MQQLYKQTLAKQQAWRRKWSPTTLLESSERAIALKQLTNGSQLGTRGLGYSSRHTRSNLSDAQRDRREVSQHVRAKDDHCRVVRLMSLQMQNDWMLWDELMDINLRWQTLLYGFSPELVKFALNATLNTLPTPDNLRR